MRIGVYEKALPVLPDWPARFAEARSAGFDFLEIAIDETDEKLARMDWPAREKQSFTAAFMAEGLPVQTLIFSVLRRFPLASPDADMRRKAGDLLRQGIEFAATTGIRRLQIPGYYSFYEPAGPDGWQRYTDALHQGAEHAADANVMLGLENMDGEDVLSLETALTHVEAVNSPWLHLYPDIGNLAANGLDVREQLKLASGHLIGIHLKDTKPGVYRRVPFGEGIVPFEDAFRTLGEIGYQGTLLIEMWNDDNPESQGIVKDSLAFIRQNLAAAGLPAETAA